MKKITFIIGLGGEQIEFKTNRDDFINELKFRYENKQLLEINLGPEIVLLNPSKILFVKIKEVAE
ncbi:MULTISPECIES: hypothetical protein [unclassified Streptococcus]|uniref:hypothetical protein n=1 Tax=unclassified Streptococcus TaxID=2608887 RepID=UPI00156712C7|nr:MULTISPECIES: hypothetical protein [unclassified Streptococcus]